MSISEQLTSRELSLGINYWPRHKAMYWWDNFELEEVHQEFNEIKQLGISHIRFFLTWETFQPKINQLNSQALKNLETLVKVAEGLHLQLMPTFFTGHMSGINWVPPWLLEVGEPNQNRFRIYTSGKLVRARLRNFYQDLNFINAQRLFISEVVSLLKPYSNIVAYDLGNETSNLLWPDSDEDAKFWLAALVDSLKGADPQAKVTLGFHSEDLESPTHLTPHKLADSLDLIQMHGYALYSPLAETPTDPYLVPFLCWFTEYLTHKPVFCGEFGACTRSSERAPETVSAQYESGSVDLLMLTEPVASEYMTGVAKLLQKLSKQPAFLWCFSDYDPALFNKAPFDKLIHERYFGLTKADGTPKQMLNDIMNIQDSKHNKPPLQISLDIDVKKFEANPLAYLKETYRLFLNIVKRTPVG